MTSHPPTRNELVEAGRRNMPLSDVPTGASPVPAVVLRQLPERHVSGAEEEEDSPDLLASPVHTYPANRRQDDERPVSCSIESAHVLLSPDVSTS